MARYTPMKQNIIESAEIVKAEDYAFRLTPAQRTFGEWVEHNVMLAYNQCSVIQGHAAPKDKIKHGATDKATLQRTILEAFAYCDEALKGMTDERALTPVQIGDRKAVPVTAMVNLVSSLNEHYGNMVGYMRTRGLVPPSTARANAQKKK